MAEESRMEVAGIRWPAVIGMRHHLIHGYAEIDLDVLWGTLIDDLPPLIENLEAILATSR